VPAPLVHLNPDFVQQVERSDRPKCGLQRIGGWPHYVTFFQVLHAETVSATPLTVQRLQRVADAVGFPRAEIFLAEAVTR